MKALAFSIKGLLLAVTLTAFGLTALLNASWVWTSVVVSVTLLVLLTALLAIPCRPSPRRAFWLGFAIFGWGYLLILHTPLGEAYQAGAPTTVVLEKAYEAINPEYERTEPDTPRILFSSGSRIEVHARPLRMRRDGVIPLDIPSKAVADKNEFHRLGNYLWAWLLALVGGVASRSFYLAQERRTKDPH